MNTTRELIGRRQLRDSQLQDKFDGYDDDEQKRDPPVATSRAAPHEGDSKGYGAEDFGLPEQGDDRRSEVEPGRMRQLDDGQDGAIDISEYAERHENGESDERQDCGRATR